MIRIERRATGRRARLFALLFGAAVSCATTALTAAWDAADARGRGHASVGRASGGFFGGRSGPSRASIRPFRASKHQARGGYRDKLRPVRKAAQGRRADRPKASLRPFRLSGSERQRQFLRREAAERARRAANSRQQQAQRLREQYQRAERRSGETFGGGPTGGSGRDGLRVNPNP